MSRVRVGLWLIILLLLTNDMRQFSGQVFDVNRLAGMDYFGYWSCGRVFMQGGNCYNSEIVHPVQKSEGRREQDTLISWNPPWTYILLLPILKFSFPLGRIVWFLLSVFMLIWAADFFWIWAGGPVGRRHLAWLCAFLFVPCAVSLNLGQITPLLMVGLAGFMWCIQKKRDLSAGIILIFLSTKPQVVYIFVLFLLLWIWQERRWKILYGSVVSMTAVVALSLWINPSVYSFYVNELRSGYGPHIWETPVLTTVLRMLFPTFEVWLRYFLPILGLTIGLLLWSKWRCSFDWIRYLIPILVLSVLTSPYGFTHDLVVLLPIATDILVRYHKCHAKQLPYVILLAGVQIVSAILIFTAERPMALVWLGPVLGIAYWLSYSAGNPKDFKESQNVTSIA